MHCEKTFRALFCTFRLLVPINKSKFMLYYEYKTVYDFNQLLEAFCWPKLTVFLVAMSGVCVFSLKNKF